MRRVYFWRYPLYSVDVRYVSEALAKVSFSPGFSLGYSTVLTVYEFRANQARCQSFIGMDSFAHRQNR